MFIEQFIGLPNSSIRYHHVFRLRLFLVLKEHHLITFKLLGPEVCDFIRICLHQWLWQCGDSSMQDRREGGGQGDKIPGARAGLGA